MNNDDQDLLNYIRESGMLDIDSVRIQIDMKRREKYLEMHQYRIWQGEKDHYWRTYLPDEEKGRKLIKKKSEELLKDEVVKYYEKNCSSEKEKARRENLTLNQLYPEWLEFKRVHTSATSTIKRICADWQKFYAPKAELINMPLNQLTKVYLDEFAHRMIRDYEMTKKCYYNVSLILRQALDYAVEKGYIDNNEFRLVKVNQKMLRRVKKKEAASQVYLREEVPLLIDEMYRRFTNKPDHTAPLAIILNFELGLRLGELVALKEDDIHDGYIHICRQEVKCFEKTNEYQMKECGYKVVEYTKTEDGDREIPLTQSAQELIGLILQTNSKYGHSCEGYLFVYGNKRTTHYSIERRIARGCQAIGIPVKSSHKIRKTVISTLIDADLNIDDIRRLVGHADERTTYSCYCFSRNTSQETREQLEQALNHGKVIKGNQKIIKFQGTKKLRKACK